jgi:hypothetical protein
MPMRRRRLTIATLMVIVALLALPLAYYGWRAREQARREEIAAWLVSYYRHYQLDPQTWAAIDEMAKKHRSQSADERAAARPRLPAAPDPPPPE